jgi:hypothetical protein
LEGTTQKYWVQAGHSSLSPDLLAFSPGGKAMTKGLLHLLMLVGVGGWGKPQAPVSRQLFLTKKDQKGRERTSRL